MGSMDAGRNRAAIERWYRAFNAQDFRELAAMVEELANPDVVQDWPQSGERIRGRANILAALENYPRLPEASVTKVRGAEDKWILTPSWTPLRISGTGDQYTVEGRVRYPNGEVWNVVDLLDFRDGRVIKLTEYFCAPFPAAEWRSPWVEKIEAG